MNEHPIIFSNEMVRAILDGRKTQTRRVTGLDDINFYKGKLTGPSPLGPLGYRGLEPTDYNLNPSSKRQFKKTPGIFHWFLGMTYDEKEINPIPVKCLYGQPGDRLWVKETWKIASFMEGEPLRFQYQSDGGESNENDCWDQLRYEEWFERVNIQSTDYLEKIKWPNKDAEGIYRWDNGKSPLPWRSPIFMPRWASRIALEIVKVRLERVQEITWIEAIMEGVGGFTVARGCLSDNPPDPRWKFIDLWNSINAKRGYGWDVNPWVWVIEFKKLEVKQ